MKVDATDAVSGQLDGTPILALFKDTSGAAIAIPPGALMAIIEDRKDPKRVWPILLETVRHDRLTFICACRRKGCTRRFIFKAKFTGIHPGLEAADGQ